MAQSSHSKPAKLYHRHYSICLWRGNHVALSRMVVNAALVSEDVYWAKELPDDQLKKMLSNSVNFGLYALPQTSAAIAGRQNPTQIGLARLITDKVSFAYLLDVFVVQEYKGKGLGKWLIECVNETLDTWPDLRRSVLLASGNQAKSIYRRNMGMEEFEPNGNLVFMTKTGPGSDLKQ